MFKVNYINNSNVLCGIFNLLMLEKDKIAFRFDSRLYFTESVGLFMNHVLLLFLVKTLVENKIETKSLLEKGFQKNQ